MRSTHERAEAIVGAAIDDLDALPGEDAEVEHRRAEEILCRALASLGHPQIVAAFERARIRADGRGYA